MTINPTFCALIPPLAPEELSQLETNILADGCRDPLVAWNGTLIDGHNRYAICQKHGIKFQTVAMDFEDEDAAKVWIIRHQFGRRNLSAYTRATLALKLEPLLKVKAKENQIKGGKEKVPQKSAEPPAERETRAELAKAAHVSHDTIAKAKVIEAKATPEAKAALHSGETSINAEYKKLTVHVGQNSGENEWYTPSEFIAAAKAVMGGIDCDPASSETANKTVAATVYFTKDDDGLTKQWIGRVWLNPPYAQPLMGRFAETVSAKYESGEITQACILVNNATETAWFQRMAKVASAICFPASRIKFLDPSGKPGAPLQGQALIYLGLDVESFVENMKQFGFVTHVI